MWTTIFANTIYWRVSALSPLCHLTPLSKIIWPYTEGFISGLFIRFQWSLCLSLSQCRAIFISYFAVCFEMRKNKASYFVHFQNQFGYSGSLNIPHEFKNGSFYFCKKCHWDFERNYTESVHWLGVYGNFHNIKSSNLPT